MRADHIVVVIIRCAERGTDMERIHEYIETRPGVLSSNDIATLSPGGGTLNDTLGSPVTFEFIETVFRPEDEEEA